MQVRILIVLSALFLSAFRLNAQNDHATRQVETVVKKFIKGLLDSDVNTLKALAHAKLTYGHSSGKIENKQQFLETFETGASDFTKIAISDQTVNVVNNTGIVRHVFDADTHDKGKAPGHVKLHIITVWEKVSGKWLLIARQAVKVQ